MGIALSERSGSPTAYVVEMGATRLVKISLVDGSVLASIGEHGKGPGMLRSPQGVAADPSSRLVYVSDTSNNRVCVFEDFLDLEFAFEFGTHGSKPGELYGPTGIAVRGDCCIVCERYNHRLSEFHAQTGEFVRTIGEQGVKPGQFREPFGVAFIDGTSTVEARGEPNVIVVSEYFGARVTVLTLQGVPIHVISPFANDPTRGLTDMHHLGGICQLPELGLCVLQPKAGALHVLQGGRPEVPTLQRLCLDTLAQHSPNLERYEELMHSLRESFVKVAMEDFLGAACCVCDVVRADGPPLYYAQERVCAQCITCAAASPIVQ